MIENGTKVIVEVDGQEVEGKVVSSVGGATGIIYIVETPFGRVAKKEKEVKEI